MEPGDLEKKLLTREEVPVHGIREGMKGTFREANLYTFIPIHPSVVSLPEEVHQDKEIALSVMNQALEWFYEDLERYVPNSPKLRQRISPKEKWENGDPIPIGQIYFYYGGPISTLAGRGGDAALSSTTINLQGHVNFSLDKLQEYLSLEPVSLILRYLRRTSRSEEEYQQRVLGRSQAHALVVMNGDFLSDHLFLRDWAILYHNKLLGMALGK